MTTEYTKNFGLAKPDFRVGPWHDLINGDLDKIDQIIYKALTGADVLEWANATAYTVGQQAVDIDSASTWMCNVDHISAASGTFAEDRAANPTYWVQLLTGFAPRGEWANATEYRPYDLAYESSSGIFAQCKTHHISNTSGTIEDDAANWYWIVNFSDANLSSAVVVSYVPTTGLEATNVQDAIDEVQSEVIALDNVNVTQGNQITTLQNTDSDHNTRLTNVEATNASQTTLITNLQTVVAQLQSDLNDLSAAVVRLVGNQTIAPGGFSATGLNRGNLTSFTADPRQGNYQYGTNTAAFTVTAPTVDGGIDLLISNGATAVIPAFSGFTVNPLKAGDTFTATDGDKFLVSMRRIGGISTYVVKALQ